MGNYIVVVFFLGVVSVVVCVYGSGEGGDDGVCEYDVGVFVCCSYDHIVSGN